MTWCITTDWMLKEMWDSSHLQVSQAWDLQKCKMMPLFSLFLFQRCYCFKKLFLLKRFTYITESYSNPGKQVSPDPSIITNRTHQWLYYWHSVAQLCPTLCELINFSMSGFPVLHHLLEFLMSIESVMPSNNLILWHPLLLLPSIFPSIRVFSKESALHIR